MTNWAIYHIGDGALKWYFYYGLIKLVGVQGILMKH
jgi:hypothetical protein